MKILFLNIWPNWNTHRVYLNHAEHEIWHVCDPGGARYIRTFLGDADIKGLTLPGGPDPNELIETLRSVHVRFPFERVVAVDERTVYTAALVRDVFDIPGPRAAEVDLYRDKRKMKARLAAHGFRVIRDVELPPLEAGRFTPCVIKGTAGTAAAGVHICRSRGEFEQHRTALGTGALLEEYVAGDFFHIDGAFNTTGVIAVPHAYIGNCYDYYQNGQPLGSVGVDDPLLKQRLLEFARQVVAAMPLRAGIFHLELIRTPDDELVFLEIACRIGGGEIYRNFVDVYNFDLLGYGIACQLGTESPLLGRLREQDVAGWLMINSFEPLPGIFSTFHCGPLAEDNCMYSMRNAWIGRKVHDREDHCVSFAFRARTAAQVRASIADLISNVRLETVPVPA